MDDRLLVLRVMEGFSDRVATELTVPEGHGLSEEKLDQKVQQLATLASRAEGLYDEVVACVPEKPPRLRARCPR